MTAKKAFSKKELADQNAKVAEIAKEEARLISSIERNEKKLAEDRERLKEVQKSRATENANLEQMIQKGIKAAAKGETGRRAALIAALLMAGEGEPDEDDGKQNGSGQGSADGTPAPTPAPAPAPAPAGRKPAQRDAAEAKEPGADDQSQSEAA